MGTDLCDGHSLWKTSSLVSFRYLSSFPAVNMYKFIAGFAVCPREQKHTIFSAKVKDSTTTSQVKIDAVCI